MTADHPSKPTVISPAPRRRITITTSRSCWTSRARPTCGPRSPRRGGSSRGRWPRGCARCPPGAQLELTLDPTASGTGDAVYSVSVAVRDEGRIAARAVGNADPAEGYRLDRAAVADMVALGWSPPGVVAGSGEHFGLVRVTTGDASQLAGLVSRTLRDVYGAPHPAFLVYLSAGRRG